MEVKPCWELRELLFPVPGWEGCHPTAWHCCHRGLRLPTLHILPALVFSCLALSWDKNPLAVPGAQLCTPGKDQAWG